MAKCNQLTDLPFKGLTHTKSNASYQATKLHDQLIMFSIKQLYQFNMKLVVTSDCCEADMCNDRY